MPSGAIMRIKWLRAALRDLDAEVAYIAEQNQEAARHLYLLVRERTAILAQFPDLGRPDVFSAPESWCWNAIPILSRIV